MQLRKRVAFYDFSTFPFGGRCGQHTHVSHASQTTRRQQRDDQGAGSLVTNAFVGDAIRLSAGGSARDAAASKNLF